MIDKSFGISIRNVMKKASKYQPFFAVYWPQCRFSTYFLPDWLLNPSRDTILENDS